MTTVLPIPTPLTAAIAYRHARADDAAALAALQAASVRTLAAGHYAPAALEAYLRLVPVMDPPPVGRGVLYVATAGGAFVACGGWTLDEAASTDGLEAPALPPGVPVVRSVYVHPGWAGRGVAAAVLHLAERAAALSGHGTLALTALLNAVPFYRRQGYAATGPAGLRLPDGSRLEGLCMVRHLPESSRAA